MWKNLFVILLAAVTIDAISDRYTFDLHGRQIAATQDVIELSIKARDAKDLITGKYLRYQLVMQFDGRSRSYPIFGARVSTKESGSVLQTSFTMPRVDAVKARKVAFCLQDTRPNLLEKLLGNDVKGCSSKIRLAPVRKNNEHDIIVGDQDSAQRVEGNAVFPQIPSFLRSFVLYDLFFHLPSKLPYTAEQIEIYLKGDKSMFPLEIGGENQLILPSVDQLSPDTFFVQLRTPQLDSRSRNYKFCIRIKREYHGKLFSANRGCSPSIAVAETGSGGSKWLSYLEEQDEKSRIGSHINLATIEKDHAEIQPVSEISDSGHITVNSLEEPVQAQGEPASTSKLNSDNVDDYVFDMDHDDMRPPKFPSLMYPGYYLDRAKARAKSETLQVGTPPVIEPGRSFRTNRSIINTH